MKKLEKFVIYNEPWGSPIELTPLVLAHKINEVIDRVNELSETKQDKLTIESTYVVDGTQGTSRQKRLLEGNNDETFVNGMKLNGSKHDFGAEPTKRFKDVFIYIGIEGYALGGFATTDEAKAARDLLLNL